MYLLFYVIYYYYNSILGQLSFEASYYTDCAVLL